MRITCPDEEEYFTTKRKQRSCRWKLSNRNPNEFGSYAHSWHCNIACMCLDAMTSDGSDFLTHADRYRISNDAASRVMKLCFGVDTTSLKQETQ